MKKKKRTNLPLDENFWDEICAFLLTEEIPLEKILKLYERTYEHQL